MQPYMSRTDTYRNRQVRVNLMSGLWAVGERTGLPTMYAILRWASVRFTSGDGVGRWQTTADWFAEQSVSKGETLWF